MRRETEVRRCPVSRRKQRKKTPPASLLLLILAHRKRKRRRSSCCLRPSVLSSTPPSRLFVGFAVRRERETRRLVAKESPQLGLGDDPVRKTSQKPDVVFFEIKPLRIFYKVQENVQNGACTEYRMMQLRDGHIDDVVPREKVYFAGFPLIFREGAVRERPSPSTQLLERNDGEPNLATGLPELTPTAKKMMQSNDEKRKTAPKSIMLNKAGQLSLRHAEADSQAARESSPFQNKEKLSICWSDSETGLALDFSIALVEVLATLVSLQSSSPTVARLFLFEKSTRSAPRLLGLNIKKNSRGSSYRENTAVEETYWLGNAED
nr:hypothetical protein Iba_chr12cCG16420 [Ipomoea batatas]